MFSFRVQSPSLLTGSTGHRDCLGVLFVEGVKTGQGQSYSSTEVFASQLSEPLAVPTLVGPKTVSRGQVNSLILFVSTPVMSSLVVDWAQNTQLTLGSTLVLLL